MSVSSFDAQDGHLAGRGGAVGALPTLRVRYADLAGDGTTVVSLIAEAKASRSAHSDSINDANRDARRAGHVGQHVADARGSVPVPAGLTGMRPGPQLGEALAGIAVRRVSGYDTVEVMAAAYRQACHARAVFLAALLETGMRRPHSGDSVSRLQQPGEFAAEEARAALVWSRRRADTTFEFAWDVHERLPMLGAAMYAGTLDEPRARAFTQWTAGLTDEQAAQIITGLLPAAAGSLVGDRPGLGGAPVPSRGPAPPGRGVPQ